MVGIRILVTGKVQGVFFRQSTREEARKLGLTGWVRNLSDGNVEVAAYGEEDATRRLIAWCQQGPRQASVESVRTEPMAFETHSDFRIAD